MAFAAALLAPSSHASLALNCCVTCQRQSAPVSLLPLALLVAMREMHCKHAALDTPHCALAIPVLSHGLKVRQHRGICS